MRYAICDTQCKRDAGIYEAIESVAPNRQDSVVFVVFQETMDRSSESFTG